MASIIQDAGQALYLESLDIPITIVTMSQLSQWSFQQDLAYNAMLPLIAADFMGLQDTFDQFAIYSSSNTILQTAWKTISSTVRLNLNVNKEIYVDPTLGPVGDLFLTIPAYSKIFSTSSDSSVSDVVGS